ncbi:MAG TPA: plastocyanin/azurin family copper-binding protein [Solirubrobacteraceae bacterium]|jgi:plastocyanin
MLAKLGHRTLWRIGPVCAAAGALFLCAGCSVKQGENPNLIEGKRQFVSKCGSCHMLARAGTKSTVGPSLDEAFRATVEDGGGRTTFRSVVEFQVQYPNPAGVMPANLASGAVLKDIASYVAQSASRSGSDKGLLAAAVQAPGSGKPALEKAGKLEIAADPAGQLSYTTKQASATAGKLTIVMPNMSGVSHNIAIQSGTSGPILGASQFITKGSVSVAVNLKPGTYTFFCQAPGHRAAGMEGTLTVK